MPEKRWPVTADECFELWLKTPKRDLRTLQKHIEHRDKIKIPMNVLTRWHVTANWVERAIHIDTMLDAELNIEAFDSIHGRLVRRRAETMELLSSGYDMLMRKSIGMIQHNNYDWHFSDGASPDVLLKTLGAMEKIVALQNSMMPVAPHRGEEEGDAELLVAGPIDPLTMAARLQALVRKKPLLELRKDSEL